MKMGRLLTIIAVLSLSLLVFLVAFMVNSKNK
jgi:hypothetical protein